MTKQAEGSFFRFDSKSEITWMQDKERAASAQPAAFF